jgi:hypothetical protein
MMFSYSYDTLGRFLVTAVVSRVLGRILLQLTASEGLERATRSGGW